jgi:sensor histidine kinase YesM
MSNVDSIFRIIICILQIIFWSVVISRISEKESHNKYVMLGTAVVCGEIIYYLMKNITYLSSYGNGIELLNISLISVYLSKVDKSIRQEVVKISVFPLVIFAFMCSTLKISLLYSILASLVIYLFIITSFLVGMFSRKFNVQYTIYEECFLTAILNWIIYYTFWIIMENSDNNSYFIAVSLSLMAGTVVIVLYVSIFEYYMIKMRNQMIHLSYVQNEINIENIKKMNEDTSRIRHDLKNCIIAIKGYSDNKDYTGLSGYIDEYSKKQIETGGIGVFCDNQVINFIINNKFMFCKQNGIQTKCIVIGNISEMSEVDLSILLGNLLDNAIEATVKCEYPSVSVEIYCDGNENTIIVDNTIKGSVLKNNKELKTSKKDTFNHGYGIASIKNIAQKNDGNVSFTEIKNIFRCKVVMKSNHESAKNNS